MFELSDSKQMLLTIKVGSKCLPINAPKGQKEEEGEGEEKTCEIINVCNNLKKI